MVYQFMELKHLLRCEHKHPLLFLPLYVKAGKPIKIIRELEDKEKQNIKDSLERLEHSWETIRRTLSKLYVKRGLFRLDLNEARRAYRANRTEQNRAEYERLVRAMLKLRKAYNLYMRRKRANPKQRALNRDDLANFEHTRLIVWK